MSSTLSSGILNRELKITWGTDLLKQRGDFSLSLMSRTGFQTKKGLLSPVGT